ncbi:transposase [Pseudalkalibacillus sp. R45]|uniref:transposase n=1 Tax=Pseudalkalibacillus sp. R45 TaxID=3457433 RepID=UPI003FCCC8FE
MRNNFLNALNLRPTLNKGSKNELEMNCTPNFRHRLKFGGAFLLASFERLTGDENLIIHSDQGWHYQMKQYRHTLKESGITQSMSRKGNCYDNAVIENFFSIMKYEFLYLNEFESTNHFIQELEKYIDYYNNKRIKAKLKGMSRVVYRTHAQQAA